MCGGMAGERGMDQVSKQHLSTEELNGGCEEAMTAAAVQWQTQSRWLSSKRAGGNLSLGVQPKAKKLRRGNTLDS